MLFHALIIMILHTVSTYSMDQTYNGWLPPLEKKCEEKIINSKLPLTLFDINKELKESNSWHTGFNPNTLQIGPDQQTVIASLIGKVYLFSLYNQNVHILSMPNPRSGSSLFNNEKPILIIEHPKMKKFAPMVKAAGYNDSTKSFIIASAGNYKAETKKSISECILYDTVSGISTKKKFDWPIQAIALDQSGSKLALVNTQNTIGIYTIEHPLQLNNIEFTQSFHYENQESMALDITFNPKGNLVITIGENGLIQLLSIINSQISSHKSITINDTLTHIYFPIYGENNRTCILYETEENEIKTLTLEQLLNPEDTLRGKPFSPTFPYESTYNHYVTYDTGYNLATAHWSSEKESYNTIMIYRQNGDKQEKTTLKAPKLEQRSRRTNTNGKIEYKPNYFLTTALRGNKVVAIATDGRLYSWILPEKQSPHDSIPTISSTGKEMEKGKDPEKNISNDSIKYKKKSSRLSSLSRHSQRSKHQETTEKK